MFKIGIIGPESTGKSTLSKYLVERYGGVLVPEYARVYLEERARACECVYAYTYDDVLHIAHQQVEHLKQLVAEDKRRISGGYTNDDVVVFDTELIITKVWMEYKYGACPTFVKEALQELPMDVYLLCYPDLDWEPDPVRENPTIREYLFDWYEREVQALGVPYYIIRHTFGDER